MSLVSGTRVITEITSRKNFIINGNFDVWQRGTSFVAVTPGSYTADRFLYSESSDAVYTISRSTDIPTYEESGHQSTYSLLLDCTTADTSIATADRCHIQYTIEGYDFANVQGGNITLSFWVKGTKTGTHCVSFRNGTADRSYIVDYTINVSNTWEKKIMIVPMDESTGTWDTINGSGLLINWGLSVGTTFHTTAGEWQTGNFLGTANQVNATDSTANDFRIAQIQLESGTEATEFEKKQHGAELALCQRYYYRSQGAGGFGYQGADGSQSSMSALMISYPTIMRVAAPTLAIITTPTYVNCSAAALAGADGGFDVRVQVTAAGRFRASAGIYDADAEL